MGLVRTSAPATEPLTLQEALDHLRADAGQEDGLITSLIQAAREQAESLIERSLITQTWRYTLDGFPACIHLPMPPLQSVSSVTYLDAAGAEQTLGASKFRVESDGEPARITPAYGGIWPVTYPVTGAVKVTYVAGWVSDVPLAIKQAMLMLIAHWYEHRTAVNVGNIVTDYPLAFDALLQPYRVYLG